MLIQKETQLEKTSEALPSIISTLLKKYTCKKLFFVRGPGSFMAIKATYIFLKTLSITLEIPLFACEGFAVNNNNPIFATGKLFFVKKNGKITTEIINDTPLESIELPSSLNQIDFTQESEPLYILPAV